MITTVAAIVAFALLFALFGALRPRAGCGGHCKGCAGTSCSLSKSSHDHV
jgi:hypothetical protein